MTLVCELVVLWTRASQKSRRNNDGWLGCLECFRAWPLSTIGSRCQLVNEDVLPG